MWQPEWTKIKRPPSLPSLTSTISLPMTIRRSLAPSGIGGAWCAWAKSKSSVASSNFQYNRLCYDTRMLLGVRLDVSSLAQFKIFRKWLAISVCWRDLLPSNVVLTLGNGGKAGTIYMLLAAICGLFFTCLCELGCCDCNDVLNGWHLWSYARDGEHSAYSVGHIITRFWSRPRLTHLRRRGGQYHWWDHFFITTSYKA